MRKRAKAGRHEAAFNRAAKEYGCNRPVIAAFWGLEAVLAPELGNRHTLPSLVSLAYACRRYERGCHETIGSRETHRPRHLCPAEMIGSWAGENSGTRRNSCRRMISNTR